MEKSKEQQLKEALEENKTLREENKRIKGVLNVLRYSVGLIEKSVLRTKELTNNIELNQKPDEENEKITFGGF